MSIAIKRRKWDERPHVAARKRRGTELSRDELLEFYEGMSSNCRTPDDTAFVAAMPLGATRRVLERRLRGPFRGCQRCTVARQPTSETPPRRQARGGRAL